MSYAQGCSAAGDVAIGTLRLTTGTPGMFMWREGVGIQEVPLAGVTEINPTAVDASGQIIVGSARTNTSRAFRWTLATGLQLLPPGVGAESASGIDASGVQIVGTGGSQGLRWLGGTHEYLQHAPGYSHARASGVSPDGQVVVGEVGLSSTQACYWRGSDTPVLIGRLPGYDKGVAYDATIGGTVIVGASVTGVTRRAMIWRYDDGLRDFRAYLVGLGVNMSAWSSLTDCFAITPDGTAAAGTGVYNGFNRAFVVRGLPPSCYGNCDASTSAPQLNVADFTCFLQRFAAGYTYANCDSSTSSPVLNVADFTCFLQQFAQCGVQ